MSNMPDESYSYSWWDETYEVGGIVIEDWEFDMVGSMMTDVSVSITGTRIIGGSALYDDGDYSGRYFDEYH